MRWCRVQSASGYQELLCYRCTIAYSSKYFPVNRLILDLHCYFYLSCVCVSVYIREAVRQRKALSRTSSNILLNSVHLQNQSCNYQPSNNRMKIQNARASDCEEPNLIIKESQQESHSEISDLEVSVHYLKSILNYMCQFVTTHDNKQTKNFVRAFFTFFLLFLLRYSLDCLSTYLSTHLRIFSYLQYFVKITKSTMSLKFHHHRLVV